jgi:hypothetical protein
MRDVDNRKALSLPKYNPPLPSGHQARTPGESVLRTRPKTYRKVVRLLPDSYWSVLQVSKNCRVSQHTVRAIREREAQDIAERKKSLAVILANVAELGAARMELVGPREAVAIAERKSLSPRRWPTSLN